MASSTRAWPPRVVIAIDIDCFYVACERLRDPSLVGKPVGVQQKTILATCSYEARALGIGKLQNVKEAKKACPQLILVNGEDLSQYRRHSRAITRLVKSIVWERRVERLGMDELFCDVTEMVQAHLETLKVQRESQDDEIYFDLAGPNSKDSKGFHYSRRSAPSLVIPGTSASNDARYAPELLAAAHLASYIRKEIYEKLHFTTSAGIAHNKLIAKLVGNLNKPNLQTTWNPDIHNWRQEQENFIAGFEAVKLQGFGHAIANTVKAALDERADVQSPESTFAVPRTLTVQTIRENLDKGTFVAKFGHKLGSRLWDLLHGDDEEPVNPSPEYPAQISIEDSHYGITSFEQAITELRKLCVHLLQRLNEDLTEDMHGGPLAGSGSKPSRNTYWALYPTNLRLTIRQGYDHSRQSVSVSFPVDALDESITAEERAEQLTKGTLSGMLRKLLNNQPADTACRITILNVCATNFTKSKPNQTIVTALARKRTSAAATCEAGQVDTQFIQLSSDEDDTSLHEPVTLDDSETESVKPLNQSQPKDYDCSQTIPLSSQDDDLVFVGEDRPIVMSCKECGSRLFAFSASAHMKFHEESRIRSTKRAPAGDSARIKKPRGH